ncbi:MAG: CDP-alcohol phosphatidyltransferase family protein [Caldilineaceae bacterium]
MNNQQPARPAPAHIDRKVRFAVVNGFTAASLILGFASIILTMAGLLTEAALCLLASVALDGCDGNLARRWQVSSSFGAQLDSMADMTAFGVAAAALAYYWLVEKEPSQLVLIAIVSGMVALTGAIRLARFNVTPKDDKYFQGIPTTFAAAVIALLYLATPNLAVLWGLGLVALLAILMVSAFPYMKLAQLRQLPKWLWLAAAVSMVFNPPAMALTFVSAYLCSGPVLWLKHQRERR